MFWADSIVEDILKSRPQKSYTVSDWKTPSGRIHVGALRGLLIHATVCRGLKEKNKKVKFIYGFDDYDPLDSLPVYLPKQYSKYLGVPLSKISAPQKGFENLGQMYAHEFKEVFEKLGEEPEIYWTSKLYKEGKFNQAIKIVLENASKIRDIYLKVAGQNQPKDWLPIQMICQNCGKIGTTFASKFDGQKVFYHCQETWVKYTEGCGYKGQNSPFDGNAKLPWKVEWAAKWFIFQSDIEGAGKDHQTKGGSHDVAAEVLKEVFKKEVPYNIFYEFILVHGRKMSSSKGVGVSAKEVSDNLPSQLLRFLIISHLPKRQVDFTPEGETIPRLFDDYDQTALAFLKDKNSDESRLYYYAHPAAEKVGFNLRFQKVAHLLQMPHIDLQDKAAEEKGSQLTPEEQKSLNERIEYAKKWLSKFAPENYKFEILEKLPASPAGGPKVTLSSQQKEFLKKLAQIFESKKNWRGEKLHSEIHNLKNQMGISPKEAFSSIYQIFLGKDFGPQAGWFLAALDRNFVLKRLQEFRT